MSQLLLDHREEIVKRWGETLAASSPALGGLPYTSLVDAMSLFVEQVAAALEGQEGVQREVARHHGEHRGSTQSKVQDVILEYSCLLGLVRDLAVELGTPLGADELLELSRVVMVGAAEAAHAYATYHHRLSQQRDAEYFAFLAHDLRNPLSSMRYAWQLMSDQGQLPSSPFVDIFDRALTRVLERLDLSLRLMQARVGITGDADVWREVDIADLLREACEDLELDARSKGVTFVRQGVASRTIAVHPSLLSAALVNLIHNAIKHSPEGGRIFLSTDVDKHLLVIAIRDEGKGIAPEVVDRIYKAFQAGHETVAGFGLGLAIVQQVIDAHAGEIHVENPQSGGCRFSIAIPLESPRSRAT